MRAIDADELKEFAIEGLEKYWQYGGMTEFTAVSVDDIDNAPTLDVEPVIHAKWEMVDHEAFWIGDQDIWMKTGKPTIRKMPVCSHCKKEFGIAVLEYKRCPECGAKMDLDKDNISEETK